MPPIGRILKAHRRPRRRRALRLVRGRAGGSARQAAQARTRRRRCAARARRTLTRSVDDPYLRLNRGVYGRRMRKIVLLSILALPLGARRAGRGVPGRPVRDPGRRVARIRARDARGAARPPRPARRRPRPLHDPLGRGRDAAPGRARAGAATRRTPGARPTPSSRACASAGSASSSPCSARRAGRTAVARGRSRRRAAPTSRTSPSRSRGRYPWVRDWTIWNEPNQRRWLSPVSPRTYVVRLLNPAYAALKAANRSNRVAGGVTAPRGNAGGLSPVAFIRGMRAARARLDAYAHHPYPTRPRFETPTSGGCGHCSTITMATLDRLIREVRRAFPAQAHLADRVRLPDEPARPAARRLEREAGAVLRRGGAEGLRGPVRGHADPLPRARRPAARGLAERRVHGGRARPSRRTTRSGCRSRRSRVAGCGRCSGARSGRAAAGSRTACASSGTGAGTGSAARAGRTPAERSRSPSGPAVARSSASGRRATARTARSWSCARGCVCEGRARRGVAEDAIPRRSGSRCARVFPASAFASPSIATGSRTTPGSRTGRARSRTASPRSSGSAPRSSASRSTGTRPKPARGRYDWR